MRSARDRDEEAVRKAVWNADVSVICVRGFDATARRKVVEEYLPFIVSNSAVLVRIGNASFLMRRS